MQIIAALTAVAMAVPAVMGAAVPNPPVVPAYGGQGPNHPPHGPKHCLQEWFGTAPLCKGKCPSGWDLVWFADRAGSCQQTNPFKIVESCHNLSSHKCISGEKALCERCFDHYGH
ncbi:hypothetical protein H072_6566 [Dactylellina haptotyla CBS 200.50]|uniref:ShKT domain-containing protein n=1 Tax=Dactylellina haptotyla (strain CBS 200.50) TaxID=1284197 RepID=S8AER8_DACHA|nr:hypothetical protein H072_6566 [Dactylellina haptotyla CBS 200.50]